MKGPLTGVATPEEVAQPGLEELRNAVARARRRLRPESPRRDAIAGFSLAVANVPDGMANGVLVGLNPLHGLYAAMVAPLVGGIFSSTRLMVITTTAAASLTAGQSLAGVPDDRRSDALFLTAILAGGFQILFGALGLARLTRFVSYSVTTGFLLGIAHEATPIVWQSTREAVADAEEFIARATRGQR